jgi:hypothetical protein
LTTAFLGSAPISVDAGSGGPDLVFDLSRHVQGAPGDPALVGRAEGFADFEVKSLPGRYREFVAAINRAINAGSEPQAPYQNHPEHALDDSTPPTW